MCKMGEMSQWGTEARDTFLLRLGLDRGERFKSQTLGTERCVSTPRGFAKYTKYVSD